MNSVPLKGKDAHHASFFFIFSVALPGGAILTTATTNSRQPYGWVPRLARRIRDADHSRPAIRSLPLVGFSLTAAVQRFTAAL